MGQPKLLLPWKGEALICHAARTALEAGLTPVVVVTGAGAVEMQAALTGLAIQMVHNPDWQVGQSTSVRAGINALPEQTQAVIFLLGDQPYVSSELIQTLVKTYAQTRPTIFAPFVGEKRTNPVCLTVPFSRLCATYRAMLARAAFSRKTRQQRCLGTTNACFLMLIPRKYRFSKPV
jgi:CTP:molybdopterin cytidylyltransferase MocA